MLSSQKSSVASIVRGSGGSPCAEGPASSFGSYRSGWVAEPSPSSVSAASTSRRPQPVYLSRPDGHSPQPVTGLASSALRSSSQATWPGVSAGSWPEQQRRGSRHLRRGERGADRVAELERPAVGVRVPCTAGAAVDQVRGNRREDPVPRRREVVVDGVPVRVVGHRAVAPHRADADHMGQRRRIVGEAPRCRGGLRPVPDGCDDDDPFA